MTVGHIRYLCATYRQQTMHLSQYKINQSPSLFFVASLRICPSHSAGGHIVFFARGNLSPRAPRPEPALRTEKSVQSPHPRHRRRRRPLAGWTGGAGLGWATVALSWRRRLWSSPLSPTLSPRPRLSPAATAAAAVTVLQLSVRSVPGGGKRNYRLRYCSPVPLAGGM